jgi:hypothetical protein
MMRPAGGSTSPLLYSERLCFFLKGQIWLCVFFKGQIWLCVFFEGTDMAVRFRDRSDPLMSLTGRHIRTCCMHAACPNIFNGYISASATSSAT